MMNAGNLLKICRCCLAMDVRMFYLKDHHLLNIITLGKISDGWICYRCRELLRKMTDFREACLASEVLLAQFYSEKMDDSVVLNEEESVRRKEFHCKLNKKLNHPTKSNTLCISVVMEEKVNSSMHVDNFDCSRVSVWSLIGSDEGKGLERNYCQDMETHCERSWSKNRLDDLHLSFVKVECDDNGDVKINNSFHGDDDYYNNDCGTDTDDESFNVPLINVAMMATNPTLFSNKMKDEKSGNIKEEHITETDVNGVKISCKYCLESLSKASQLSLHYSNCEERKRKRAAMKRCAVVGDVQSIDVIKIEPRDVDESEAIFSDILTEHNTFVKVKKKKKKSNKKLLKKHLEGNVMAYYCEVCPKAFLRQSQLQRHVRIHTGERPFKCDFKECDYSSSRADDLKKHQRRHTGDKPYACTIEGCQFASPYAHHLKRHMRAHSGTKELMCDSCGKKFRESSVLKQHQLSAHSSVKPYACEECDYTTAYPNLLKDHQTQTHRADGSTGKNYICDECGHSYWRADQLKVHKRVHSGEKPFRCDVCSFATSHSNALKVHKRSHSNERPYVCEECAHAFARKDDLKTHMRIHSGDRPYACDRCPYTAAQKSNLKRHKISHLGIKPFCCDECGKRFAEASSLKMHKRLHAGVRPFKCPHCPYSTSQSGGLKRHLVSHSGEKPFVCHVCGKAFTLIYDLNNHSRIHTGEKPYSCDVCNFATSHHNALKIHKRSHTGEKPFRCDVCAQCFSRGGDLKTHKRIHTGEKPYACTVCCYTATQASNLKRHMVSHSGKKPFTCGDCGKSFTEAGTLRIHRRTHTGERPYCCHHCAQAFSQAGHLRKHMRQHANLTSSNNAASSTPDNNAPILITPTSNAVQLGEVFKNEINSTVNQSSSTSQILNNLNENVVRSSNEADSNLVANDARHTCPDCGQCFSQLQQLTKHMASHSNQDVDDDKSNVIIQLALPTK